VAIEGLQRLAHHLGISEEKIGEAKILVTEAILNALEHAGEKNLTVRVEFTMTTKEIIIFVQDLEKGLSRRQWKNLIFSRRWERRTRAVGD